MPSLAIDTSDRSAHVAVCGTALGLGRVSYSSSDLRSVEQLPRLVRSCLSELGLELEQITTVLVSIGPGSFTGIRAGLAFAQGLHAAKPRRLLGVSALLARGHWYCQAEKLSEKRFTVSLVASKTELYTTQLYFTASQTIPQSLVETILKPEFAIDSEDFERAECIPLDSISGSMALLSYYEDCLIDSSREAFRVISNQFSLDSLFGQVADLNISEQVAPLYVKPLSAKTLVERGLR